MKEVSNLSKVNIRNLTPKESENNMFPDGEKVTKRSWVRGIDSLLDILSQLSNQGCDKRTIAETMFEILSHPKASLSILYDWCYENHMCPECLGELKLYTWKEPRPYGDTTVYEVMNELVCSNKECDWERVN